MIAEDAFATLLTCVADAYQGHPALSAFAPFPDDVTPQPVAANDLTCAGYFAKETGLATDRYAALHAAIHAAGPFALWRETYKDTDIGADFMARFGCYSIIGPGGPYTSAKVWMWMVYMPADLVYPRHHHPGEEMYLVIAGYATFQRDGAAEQVLGPGGSVFHASNQPHAMATTDSPVLCLVAWRNGFETPPVLTSP